MTKHIYDELSRLERRIMDAVYHLGKASVAEVVRELDEDEVYHSIRVTMAKLTKRGLLKSRRVGTRNVYAPAIRQERARRTAADNLVRTFFGGSPVHAMLHFLDRSDTGLSPEDAADIRAMIENAEQTDPRRKR